MKKLQLLIMTLSAVVSIGVTSCSNAEELLPEQMPDVENTTYEVSLSLSGEYTEVTEEPLGRANAHKKYYGVNVYCMKTDGSENSYSNYAYGVFDNVSDMKITLLSGYKYKFECTSVTEDTDRLYVETYESYNYTYEWLSAPFRESTYSSVGSWSDRVFHTKNINRFIVSQGTYLADIKEGYSMIAYRVYYGNEEFYDESRNVYYPRMDRYYGELEDFVPASGVTANIPMKRTAFGIKIIVNGVPDGNLVWSDNASQSSYSSLMFNCNDCSGMEKLEFSQIYTFSGVYDCWKSEEAYTVNFTVYFTWTRANGYKQYFNERITVKRNVMTTITVNLKGGANDVTIGVDEDDTPMDSESINIDYDGGDLNDTPVNPQE